MNSNSKKGNFLLFNLITLLTFGATLFLIIFLKRDKGKKFEHKQMDFPKKESRVKKGNQSLIKELKGLNKRQITILARMEREGSMDPNEIYELVPNVSTRTVRRDMDKLIEKGFVLQKGTTKSTQYIFKG